MDVPSVWVLDADAGFGQMGFPSGVFASTEAAEAWILRNSLSGSLTQYPLGEGYYDHWRKSGSHPPVPGRHFLHADSTPSSIFKDGALVRSVQPLQSEVSVWAFHGRPEFGLSAGIFRFEDEALRWAEVNAFNGIATEYPIDISVYDYVKGKGWFTKELPRERLATFTSGYVDHTHIEECPV